ncbi:unnamed protein product, partial [Ectocarpus sp. 4 AP-2014]
SVGQVLHRADRRGWKFDIYILAMGTSPLSCQVTKQPKPARQSHKARKDKKKELFPTRNEHAHDSKTRRHQSSLVAQNCHTFPHIRRDQKLHTSSHAQRLDTN